MKKYCSVLKRKTVSGIPEEIKTYATDTYYNEWEREALEKHSVYNINDEDYVVIGAVSQEILDTYLKGFIQAHMVCSLSPVRSLQLHTNN